MNELKQLKDWLRDNGAVEAADGPVQPHDFGGGMGRGMVALSDLYVGQLLVRIPFRLLLTPAVARAGLPSHPAFDDDDTVALCTFLALERRKKERSFWSAYIATLPNETDFTCCTAFTPTQSALLGKVAPDIRVMTEKYVGEMNAGYAAAIAALNGVDAVPTMLDYRWAFGMVLTRACYFGKGSCCLVPFTDMLNHAAEARTEVRFADGFYEVVTLTPVARGDQVFISYGSHDNASLVALYGFALHDNCCDKVRADLALQQAMHENPECNQDLDRKQALFFEIAGMTSARDLFLYPGGEIPWNVSAFLRIYCMDRSELQRDLHKNVTNDCEVSPQNERRVFAVIQRTCVVLLKTLDETATTADEETSIDTWSRQTLALFVTEHRKIIEQVLKHITQSETSFHRL